MSKTKDKLIFRSILAISLLVFILVLVLNKRILPIPENIPGFVYRLPLLNGIINGTCFILLSISYFMIRRNKVEIHKRLNLTTFGLSSLFLLSYVTYHWLVPETSFGGEGAMRLFYYFILVSHIILAAGVLPLVLLSFYYGLTDNRRNHKKIVRWSFPVWLYVTLSGVIVYLMISPYYSFPS